MLTKQDLKEEFNSVRKEFKTEIENAVAQISSAVGKALKNLATKEDLEKLANKEDLAGVKEEVHNLKIEVKYLRNDVNDLKADAPTAKEFQNHEKRITKLESLAAA